MQDLRQAKLLVVSDFAKVERKIRFMAALNGAVLLSSSVLLGKGGTKLVYHPGQDLQIAVYVTEAFKAEDPGLTVLLREACNRGWQAVLPEQLKGRGRKPSLFLQGAGERTQGFHNTNVKCFESADFLRWLTTTCLNKEMSARVNPRA